MAENFYVCGEEGKALVDDFPFDAEFADVAVPAEMGEAAVLHEGGRFGVGSSHLMKVA